MAHHELVSIVMPAYNAEQFIGEAISSVLGQDHGQWELLVVNDGSTDGTAALLERYTDPRIRVFHQENKGIGGARNRGLKEARGHYLCFLDADDLMPVRSLSARLEVMRLHPDTDVVDGCTETMNATLSVRLATYRPDFEGDPFLEMISLSGRCFFGNTWLMRWVPGDPRRFPERLSHGEDLMFYLQMGPGHRYRYTTETVLIYRRTGHSTMSDLDGLERSYATISAWLRSQRRHVPLHSWLLFEVRSRRMMAGAFWKGGQLRRMCTALFGHRPHFVDALTLDINEA